MEWTYAIGEQQKASGAFIVPLKKKQNSKLKIKIKN